MQAFAYVFDTVFVAQGGAKIDVGKKSLFCQFYEFSPTWRYAVLWFFSNRSNDCSTSGGWRQLRCNDADPLNLNRLTPAEGRFGSSQDPYPAAFFYWRMR